MYMLLYVSRNVVFIFFFFNDTATTEIYTLSLHDALPIFRVRGVGAHGRVGRGLRSWGSMPRVEGAGIRGRGVDAEGGERSEEHTSELQSQSNLVCRLLLEKKKNNFYYERLLFSDS